LGPLFPPTFDTSRAIMGGASAETGILGQTDAPAVQGAGKRSDRKSEGL
jgi:hypothetical protein